MKNIITSLARVTRNAYFPFFILFLVYFSLHFLMAFDYHDDPQYMKMAQSNSLIPYLVNLYMGWTSRLAIFFANWYLLGHLPAFVWRILNPAMFVGIGILISLLITSKPTMKLNWIITFFLFSYSFIDMRSAGWVTTSVNYVWVAFFALLAIFIAQRHLAGHRVHPLINGLGILAALYASNQEQMAVVMLLYFLVVSALALHRKRLHWFLPVGIFVTVANIFFALRSPGNAIRQSVEFRWFVDFDMLSIIDKLEIGFSATMERLVFRPDLLFALFCLTLAIVVIRRYPSWVHRILALLPFFIVFYFGFLVRANFPFLQGIQYLITDKGYITLENFTQIRSYLPFLVIGIAMVMVLSLVLSVFRERKGLLAGGILLLGFISRLVMGFSQTVWASSSRTMMFLYLAFILCIGLLVEEEIRENSEIIPPLIVVSGFVAAISLLNLVALI